MFVAFGRILSRGLHPPTFLQLSFLVVAIVLEIVGFIYLWPAVRPRGELWAKECDISGKRDSSLCPQA